MGPNAYRSHGGSLLELPKILPSACLCFLKKSTVTSQKTPESSRKVNNTIVTLETFYDIIHKSCKVLLFKKLSWVVTLLYYADPHHMPLISLNGIHVFRIWTLSHLLTAWWLECDLLGDWIFWKIFQKCLFWPKMSKLSEIKKLVPGDDIFAFHAPGTLAI